MGYYWQYIRKILQDILKFLQSFNTDRSRSIVLNRGLATSS